jgi:hypothetical protein
MTAPTAELWRVLDDHPAAPAHLVRRRDESSNTVVTACGWQPKFTGMLISREQLLAKSLFGCTCCLRHAKRSVLIAEQVHDSRGGWA